MGAEDRISRLDNCWKQFSKIGNFSHFEAAQRNADLSLAMFMRMRMRNLSQVERETFPPGEKFLLRMGRE